TLLDQNFVLAADYEYDIIIMRILLEQKLFGSYEFDIISQTVKTCNREHQAEIHLIDQL
ncbi:3806_t:CDS:1, partial [Racocetra persica]